MMMILKAQVDKDGCKYYILPTIKHYPKDGWIYSSAIKDLNIQRQHQEHTEKGIEKRLADFIEVNLEELFLMPLTENRNLQQIV